MRMPLVSKVLFILVSITLAVGAHLADFGPTHIFNPLWPPHAKFHTGQTLSFSILLGLLTIYFACRKTKDKTYAVLTTASFASSYWITQACAILDPGTAFFDPNFAGNPGTMLFGIPAQLCIDVVHLAIIIVASLYALNPRHEWQS